MDSGYQSRVINSNGFVYKFKIKYYFANIKPLFGFSMCDKEQRKYHKIMYNTRGFSPNLFNSTIL